MKILHLTPFFYPDIGGIETFSANLVASLQEHGHENFVFTSRKTQDIPDISDFHGAMVQRVNFMNAIHNTNLPDILIAKKQLEKIKRSFSPNVIVIHVGGELAYLHLITPEVVPVPLVTVCYDLTPSGEPSPSLRKLFMQSNHIIAISQARLADARLIAPEAMDRMSLIYNGIPVREPIPAVESSPTPLVLMTARLVSTKGFDVAVEAFSQVHEEIPEAQLYLVGKGPIHQELDHQIKRLGLQDTVKLLGYLPEIDLSRLYHQAWITLVPSRHSESFGLVAVEAMQASCPVIASRVGGLAEVVVDGETGLLVPREDPQVLAKAILKLLKDRPLGIKMGQAGFSRARRFFNWDNCISGYESVFLKAANI